MSLRVIAIDWSGAKYRAERKIWLAEVAAGRVQHLENGRDRGDVANHLITQAERNPRLIVGLDFAFSFPAWFCGQQGVASVHDLWALAERKGERWLAACEPPFWGLAGRRRAACAGPFRRTERELPDWAHPKSVFQVGGAGSVGTGSIRGMPVLRRLHEAGFSIWPFDRPAWPLIVEMYPRLLTGPVTKSDPYKRAKHLTRYPELPKALRRLATSSEDAFDAVVSALVMGQHQESFASLSPPRDTQRLLEGAIWHPGCRE